MILISHRGNTSGINKDLENKPDYILSALNDSYDVEIDIWHYKDELYLGHDEPNILHRLNVHYFWHQNDDITITNKGYWWTFPGKKLYTNSICVLPENFNQDITSCAGCCSDIIDKYK
jgi:hypothetical protein